MYNSSTNALTIIRSSYVNDMSDYCVANVHAAGCSPTPDLPGAENLHIYTNSNGNVGNDNGQGYDFGGILYATTQLTQDGCKSQYTWCAGHQHPHLQRVGPTSTSATAAPSDRTRALDGGQLCGSTLRV